MKSRAQIALEFIHDEIVIMNNSIFSKSSSISKTAKELQTLLNAYEILKSRVRL